MHTSASKDDAKALAKRHEAVLFGANVRQNRVGKVRPLEQVRLAAELEQSKLKANGDLGVRAIRVHIAEKKR